MIDKNIPKISVIMPSFNGIKYLEKAINSFIVQDYPNEKKELIIVDGKSTDGSFDIIEKFQSLYSNIIWVKYNDKGISDAYNKGIEVVTGDIIGRLGTDDLLNDNVFNSISNIYNTDEFDAVYFDSYNYYPDKDLKTLRECPRIDFTLNNLLSFGAIVGGEDIYMKKHIFEKYSFNPNNKYSMDYELLLEITSKENYKYKYLNQVCSTHYCDGNISTDYVLSNLQFKECVKLVKKYRGNYKGSAYFSEEKKDRTRVIFLLKKIIKKIIHFNIFK